ncbi:J domain-containing protein [Chondromyces apiculatus]|uniref:J domain-containing protein n=1 Tax=Chondromyces apiculatus DSM 436 TaxID=1192034 RepID=A0A017SUI7_9BACT|nr:J domain-containing protein [Chondromyces apiculatus]EYF00638.1 Hypothetical protein CAP_0391 [Chondromyces apiculatus DSM 436]
MTSLPPGHLSITTTKRRRYLWCAWWTAAPSREPFRKPDAFAGGARTLEEARRAAERAAGRPLQDIEPSWAGAWVRIQAGLPPFPEKKPKRPRPEPPPPGDAHRSRQKRRPDRPPGVTSRTSPFTLLGLPATAPLADIKRAFRRLALLTHPDQGGDPAAFMQVRWAYEEALARHRDPAAR